MTAPTHIGTACATAPGKVILLGEHAVVYGRAALAAAIDRHVTVHITRLDQEERALRPCSGQASRASAGPVRDPLETDSSSVHPEVLEGCALNDPRLAAALARAADIVGLATNGWDATISTDLPIAMGLGSSAALSVALVRALARFADRPLNPAAVCAGAFEIEKIFHGSPSGIDNTAATSGGLISFTRGVAARRLQASRPLPLVVALGRVSRRTWQTVTALRQRWEANPADCEPLFDEIATLVHSAERAIAAGDLRALGTAMNANHAVLRRLKISTDELEQMVNLARAHGATGAKLTGGGGGGAVICLCDDGRADLVDAFVRAGWHAFATDIAATQRGAHAADSTGYVEQHVGPRA
jgi:hydroxymethylglutaryl-CoA reductase